MKHFPEIECICISFRGFATSSSAPPRSHIKDGFCPGHVYGATTRCVRVCGRLFGWIGGRLLVSWEKCVGLADATINFAGWPYAASGAERTAKCRYGVREAAYIVSYFTSSQVHCANIVCNLRRAVFKLPVWTLPSNVEQKWWGVLGIYKSKVWPNADRPRTSFNAKYDYIRSFAHDEHTWHTHTYRVLTFPTWRRVWLLPLAHLLLRSLRSSPGCTFFSGVLWFVYSFHLAHILKLTHSVFVRNYMKLISMQAM